MFKKIGFFLKNIARKRPESKNLVGVEAFVSDAALREGDVGFEYVVTKILRFKISKRKDPEAAKFVKNSWLPRGDCVAPFRIGNITDPSKPGANICVTEDRNSITIIIEIYNARP